MSKRILIVEDERLLLKTLSDALRELGYDIVAARSAEEAEAVLFGDEGAQAPATTPFDLVVLDNRLPDRSGVDVLRRIRGAGWPLDVIVMTAYGTSALKAELNELGVKGFLSKPFDLDQMLDEIADTVGETSS